VGTDPETGLTIYAKEGRFGPYVQLGTKEEAIARGDAKPKMASIPKGSTIETVSLETACKALSLPRTVGIYEGKPVIATIGRYGPYIKFGDEIRSIPRQKNYDPFTISLENAIELLSEPKKGKRNFSKNTNNTSK
jgi:DNA topoisomerase-1